MSHGDPQTTGDGAARRRPGWIHRAAILGAVLLLAFLRRPGVPRDEPRASRPGALDPWEMLGCYEVHVRPWGPGAPGPVPDSLLDRTARSGRASPGAVPPSRVLLLPDSVDRWGRMLDSYRARGLGADSARGERYLRWLVHGDTLWIVWSERTTRGGIALQRAGDSLAGSARARVGTDSLDLGTRATAWPVNCATGAREPLPPRSRRR